MRDVCVFEMCPGFDARNRIVSSKLPVNEKCPSSSVVVNIPVCGPSRISTVASATRLEAVSYTSPLKRSSCETGGGRGGPGTTGNGSWLGEAGGARRESPQPTSTSADARNRQRRVRSDVVTTPLCVEMPGDAD